MTIACVFPGQGSQAVGMLAELAKRFPSVRSTFEEGSGVLGYDVWELAQNGPEDKLNQTIYTQPALLIADVAVYNAYRESGGVEPAMVAGHSLGEYPALVVSGALRFWDAVHLVKLRAELMQDAVPVGQGGMMAVLGLEDDIVEASCLEVSEAATNPDEVVVAANYNAPGQVVISGSKGLVERAGELCKEKGAKRVIPVQISVPSHCPLMRKAADKLATAIEEVEFREARIPVIQNVSGRGNTEIATISSELIKQLYMPVRWTQSVLHMVEKGATHFQECGPNKVLCGLIRRCAKTIEVEQVESTLTKV